MFYKKSIDSNNNNNTRKKVKQNKNKKEFEEITRQDYVYKRKTE